MLSKYVIGHFDGSFEGKKVEFKNKLQGERSEREGLKEFVLA